MPAWMAVACPNLGPDAQQVEHAEVDREPCSAPDHELFAARARSKCLNRYGDQRLSGMRDSTVVAPALPAVCVRSQAVYLAFHLYIFGGDPMISAILVIVAVVATGLAF